MNTHLHQNIKINHLPQSEIEIEGEIPADFLEKCWETTLKKTVTETEVDGFRKGHVPEDVVIKKVGEMNILHRAAETALGDAYPEILKENGLNAIGLPRITITKIARRNPLGFKIRTALFPDISLSEYKNTAKKIMEQKDDLAISDKEVEKVIETIQQQKKEQDKLEALPEVNDIFVKSLGDFSDVEDFTKKIRGNLEYEKKVRAREKKRIAIIDNLIEKSKIDLPEIIVEEELRKMFAEFEGELKTSGITLEQYLGQIKKSVEDLQKTWRETAIKRAKTQLILNTVATNEKIEPAEDQVEKEVKHLLSHYKEADPTRVKIYIESVLKNEKVFEFLEGNSTLSQAKKQE
ncbi:MAG: hypothetical protein KAR00_00125 [Candidatus Pacebacteria bacterium]|nr:hypothetical protein [Candidatus Paceibacterota bacterium]